MVYCDRDNEVLYVFIDVLVYKQEGRIEGIHPSNIVDDVYELDINYSVSNRFLIKVASVNVQHPVNVNSIPLLVNIVHHVSSLVYVDVCRSNPVYS